MDTDTKWMTYAELGEVLGIEAASAKRLAIRRRWPKRPGNDGRARVGVPIESLAERAPGNVTSGRAGDATLSRTGDTPGDSTGIAAAAVTVLTDHIRRLEADIEVLKQERAEARVSASDRDVIAAQLAALEAVVAAERRRIEDLRADRDNLRADRDRWAAQAECLALPSPETKRNGGWWPFRRAG